MKKLLKNKKLMLALGAAAVLFFVMKNQSASAAIAPGRRVDPTKRPSVNIFSKGSKSTAYTGE